MNPKCLGGSVPDTFDARSADLTGLKMRRITRGEFITLLGAAAATSLAWPLAAGAPQRGPVPGVGDFSTPTRGSDGPRLAAARRGLGGAGEVVGATLAAEYTRAG